MTGSGREMVAVVAVHSKFLLVPLPPVQNLTARTAKNARACKKAQRMRAYQVTGSGGEMVAVVAVCSTVLSVPLPPALKLTACAAQAAHQLASWLCT